MFTFDAAKAALLPYKWLAIAVALLCSHGFVAWKAMEYEQNKYTKLMAKAVEKEAEKGKKAVAVAEKRAAEAAALDRDNEERERAFDQLEDKSNCSFTEPELNLLREAVAKTKR